MGLGGHLTWSAAIREISNRHNVPVHPCEIDMNGNYYKTVESDIFLHNPYITHEVSNDGVYYLPMNIPDTNYCKEDYPDRCVQRSDKHAIEQICEYHNIFDPELKCDLFFHDNEYNNAENLLDDISDLFFVIEPYSNREYTVNRSYPFDKWQTIVNAIHKEVEVVQVGIHADHVLDNVTSLVGKTTFREAACLIGYSELMIGAEGGLIHASTAVETKALSIVSGYEDPKLWNYPQNINVYIGTHGPCGWKIPCDECKADAENHDENEIINLIMKEIER